MYYSGQETLFRNLFIACGLKFRKTTEGLKCWWFAVYHSMPRLLGRTKRVCLKRSRAQSLGSDPLKATLYQSNTMIWFGFWYSRSAKGPYCDWWHHEFKNCEDIFNNLSVAISEQRKQVLNLWLQVLKGVLGHSWTHSKPTQFLLHDLQTSI